MSDLYELRCRECGKSWGNAPRSFCEECFSPLEVVYDYDSLKKCVRRENLSRRDFNMWRYSELLPLLKDYNGPNAVGGTPLVASRKLGREWGIANLYIKNDAVSFPLYLLKTVWSLPHWPALGASDLILWVLVHRQPGERRGGARGRRRL